MIMGSRKTGLARVRLPVRPALGAPAPQGLDDVLFQFALGLDVDGLVDRLRAHMHSVIIREIGRRRPRTYCSGLQCARNPARMYASRPGASAVLRAWVVWAVRAHLLGPVRLVHAGRGIRVAHQLAAGGRRGTIERARAIRARSCQALRQSAMLMRSSWLRYLELILGMSTVERYQSTERFLVPAVRVSFRCATPCRCVWTRRPPARPA